MQYAQLCINGLSIYATVYIVYTHLAKSKRPHMFTEVNIYTFYYLSHWCHTGVNLLFSIYLHRVTGSLDKTRCRHICLQLPVTLSH